MDNYGKTHLHSKNCQHVTQETVPPQKAIPVDQMRLTTEDDSAAFVRLV